MKLEKALWMNHLHSALRQAHNLKVAGSNPAPATKKTTIISRLRKASERTSGAFLFMSDPYRKNVGRRASGIVRNPVLVRT
jgi:hypothetical protein